MQLTFPAAAVCLLAFASVLAAAENPATDWFHKAGYGVFVHYLESLQNNPQRLHSLQRKTSWDECVHEFDVERFAAQMADVNAGYVIFTMQQRTRFLIAPNATFDKLTGYKPGEACATRDLVLDLYQALHKRNIPLMLYWTGDGPQDDAKAAAAFGGFTNPISAQYVKNWAAVAEEYGQRYGDKVSGWWTDGCYSFIGYDQEKLTILANGLRAGNPNRIIALNPGVQDHVRAYTPLEDFTCGEQPAFEDLPTSRWIGGEQWHILSFLGCPPATDPQNGWAQPGVRNPREKLTEYIAKVNRAGGVVSIDVLLYRDGELDRSQLLMLKGLREAIAAQGNNHSPK